MRALIFLTLASWVYLNYLHLQARAKGLGAPIKAYENIHATHRKGKRNEAR